MSRHVGGRPVLSVRDVRTRFRVQGGGAVHAVNGVSFDLHAGELLGVVGESGSGKSVTMLSLLRLLPTPPAEIVSGQALLEGEDLLALDPARLRRVRGAKVGFVFQDPMASLNPVLSVGYQLAEPLRTHLGLGRRAARRRAAALLERVGIPAAESRLGDFPHQFSGGMRQRVMIAMALACDPKVLIADEPTTALDATIQAQILELLQRLRRERGMAIVWITHDLGVVAGLADRVMVMYGGQVVEHADVRSLYARPQHPYTQSLLRALPRIDGGGERERLASIPGQPPTLMHAPDGCPFAPRCAHAFDRCREENPTLAPVADGHAVACWYDADAGAPVPPDAEPLLAVENLTKHFPVMRGVLRRQVGAVRAVDGLDFAIYPRETLGLVGESGCGKSTAGRVILRLDAPTTGRVIFRGEDITALQGEALRQLRPHMQMIFQDPQDSLNPRMTVGSIVAEPLREHGVAAGAALRQRVEALLEAVGLDPAFANRYPHEFSGGQRQRIGIARALALKPAFIVSDEPIAALDVSTQAQVVNLLKDLQERFGLTYLFISHDLRMVRHVADRVAVMYLGKIVELAASDALYEEPLHPYTRALLSAVPTHDPEREARRQRIVLVGDVPSPAAPPPGCRFSTRCPVATPECSRRAPEWRTLRPGHQVACHLAE